MLLCPTVCDVSRESRALLGQQAGSRAASGHACRAGADQEEHWFAQLRLVFSCRDSTGAEHRLVFLRWLMCTEGAELPMQRLTWATRGPAGGTQRAWYDCQEIDCIERPVLLQPDPGHDGFFYYNHFMRCGGVPALCHCRRCAAAPCSARPAACSIALLPRMPPWHGLPTCVTAEVPCVCLQLWPELSTEPFVLQECAVLEDSSGAMLLSDSSVPDSSGAVGEGGMWRAQQALMAMGSHRMAGEQL